MKASETELSISEVTPLLLPSSSESVTNSTTDTDSGESDSYGYDDDDDEHDSDHGDGDGRGSGRSSRFDTGRRRGIMAASSSSGTTATSTGTTNNKREMLASLRQLSERIILVVSHHTGTIGYLGSVSIAVNSLTGPAMLSLPALYARAGIIPTTAAIVFVAVLASFGCLHMSDTISKVGGDGRNHNFKQEVEFSQAFHIFWGKEWFYITQVLFFCCITCLNISSIVDTAQVVDTLLGHWLGGTFGGTAALMLRFGDENGTPTTTTTPAVRTTTTMEWIRWDAQSSCTQSDLMNGLCIPFRDVTDAHDGQNGGDGSAMSVLITAGTVITTAFFLPLSLLDLKETAWWQVVAFAILLVTSAQFIIQFCINIITQDDDYYHHTDYYEDDDFNNTVSASTDEAYLADDDGGGVVPLSSSVTWWGYEWNDMMGVILFNFALVLIVPAWLYEREPHVDVPAVVHGSMGLSVLLYVAVGVLGHMALPNVSDNMLETMMSGVMGTWIQIGAGIFAFFIVGLGIPLFSVMARLNLTGTGLCNASAGNLLAVHLPFAASWLLYGSDSVVELLSWGGMVFTGLVSFVLPLVLAISVVHSNSSAVGSIDVYFGYLQSKRQQIVALAILLFLTVASIVLAMGSNIV